jgi:hypothetical protein
MPEEFPMQRRSLPEGERPTVCRPRCRPRGGALRRFALAGAAAAAAAALVLGARRLEATDRTVSDQQARCLGTANASARAVALEKLRSLSSGAVSADAIEAMDAVADARDDRTAVQGLATLGRSDHTGARTKLRSVFEDTRRSDVARGAAFLSFARLERAGGRSWSSLSDYAGRHCRSGSRLAAIVAAAQNAPAGSE